MFDHAVATEAPQILVWTIKAREEGLFNFLLEQRIDIHRPDEEGKTTLCHASLLGFTSVVRGLLDAGANVQWATGSVTLLHVAADGN